MKTDKYNELKVGDRYNEGEYLLAVHKDIQTIKYVLLALIDEVTIGSVIPDTTFQIRRFLRDKLEEK